MTRLKRDHISTALLLGSCLVYCHFSGCKIPDLRIIDISTMIGRPYGITGFAPSQTLLNMSCMTGPIPQTYFRACMMST